MSRSNLNYIVLHDGEFYRVFERLGKKVPYSAYNPMKHQGIGITIEETLENSTVPRWMIEDEPIEVIFHD